MQKHLALVSRRDRVLYVRALFILFVAILNVVRAVRPRAQEARLRALIDRLSVVPVVTQNNDRRVNQSPRNR